MSSHVSNIISGLKTVISTTLGSTYAELPFGYNIDDNSKIVARKGYSCKPSGTSEVDGINKVYTVDQGFEIILNDVFLSSSTNDSAKRSAIISLYDKIFDIYVEIVKQKAGNPANVMIVNNMSIEEPEIFEEADFATIRMRLNIKHRFSI